MENLRRRKNIGTTEMVNVGEMSGHGRNCPSAASFSDIANEPYIYPKKPRRESLTGSIKYETYPLP